MFTSKLKLSKIFRKRGKNVDSPAYIVWCFGVLLLVVQFVKKSQMKRIIVWSMGRDHFIPHSWFMKTPEDGTKNIIDLYERGLINIKESVSALIGRLFYEDWSTIQPEPFSLNLYGSQFSDTSYDHAYYWVRENFDFAQDKTLGVKFSCVEMFEEFKKIFPMKEQPLYDICNDGWCRVNLSLTFKERFALSRLKQDHGWELVVPTE